MRIKKEVMIFIFLSVFLFSNILLIQSQEVSTLATVEVRPAYALVINIEILDDKISSGENLNVLISLTKTKLASISEEISVDLNYEITKKGKKGQLIESGFLKTVNIIDEKTVEVSIPSELKGRYILKIIEVNPQAFPDEDSETFVVRKKAISGFLAFFLFKGIINLIYLF